MEYTTYATYTPDKPQTAYEKAVEALRLAYIKRQKDVISLGAVQESLRLADYYREDRVRLDDFYREVTGA